MCDVCKYSPYEHEEFIRLLSETLDKAIFGFGEQRWGPTPPELIPPAFRARAE